MTIYITLDQVVELHDVLILKYGGLQGIRDVNLLLSAIEAPKVSLFGKDMYPSLQEKAACYLYHIVKNHPFNDANKRTGYAATLIFLEINNFSHDILQDDLEQLVLGVAAGTKNKNDVVNFISKRYISDIT